MKVSHLSYMSSSCSFGFSSEGWASDMVTEEILINCGFCFSVSAFSLECKLVSLCSIINTVLNYSNFF